MEAHAPFAAITEFSPDGVRSVGNSHDEVGHAVSCEELYLIGYQRAVEQRQDGLRALIRQGPQSRTKAADEQDCLCDG